ncbi:TRP-like ion channel Pkd2, variant 2 [Cymbomonas tetramitiformis]|uniref:TRP-like ion channel Pkd2, variant 2 n=1 Tax=Cymbomonas tetramitiformis TaxID=36881 RepID=A0AAE0GEF8_9CHLO|nr:TRP-like ion channel Pkd2, variant 2 [Cymbomonas tetramitiformis]
MNAEYCSREQPYVTSCDERALHLSRSPEFIQNLTSSLERCSFLWIRLLCRELTGYIAFTIVYLCALSYLSSTTQTNEVISAIKLSFLPQTERFENNLELLQWLSNSVKQIWKPTECGNAICEEPYERPAFGSVGCQVDCGLEGNLVSVVIEIQGDFTESPSTAISPTELLQSVKWNVCQRNEGQEKYGVADDCWYEADRQFEFFGEVVVEELQLPQGEWFVRIHGDYYHFVQGRVYTYDTNGRLVALETAPGWLTCQAEAWRVDAEPSRRRGRALQDTDSYITSNLDSDSDSDMYELLVTDGALSCSDHAENCRDVSDSEECNDVAADLNLDDLTSTDEVLEALPYGCIYTRNFGGHSDYAEYGDHTLYFNTGGTGSCTEQNQCLCVCIQGRYSSSPPSPTSTTSTPTTASSTSSSSTTSSASTTSSSTASAPSSSTTHHMPPPPPPPPPTSASISITTSTITITTSIPSPAATSRHHHRTSITVPTSTITITTLRHHHRHLRHHHHHLRHLSPPPPSPSPPHAITIATSAITITISAITITSSAITIATPPPITITTSTITIPTSTTHHPTSAITIATS